MAARILILGDDQTDKVVSIRKLYRLSRTRPQLCKFLRSATDVVQLQLTALAASHEDLDFGHFNDLLELSEHVQAADYPEATANAVLVTALQVGELLCLTEDDTSILSGFSNVHPLGFCLGLLATSVLAGSRDTSDLVRLGVGVVEVSFRLGLELRRRARLIEDSPGGWSVVVVGSKDDIETRLKAFNQNLPLLRHAYPGVVASAWTTIFGPPSTIAALASSTTFADFPKSPHLGTTAVHAPHLPPADIDRIVGRSPLFEETAIYRTIISCSTCRPFQATTVKRLLEMAIVDIVASPLWPEEATKALLATLEVSEVVLTQIGSSSYTPVIQRLLRAWHIASRLDPVAQLAHPCVDSRGDSGLIAIVGMSGRFPGCNAGLEDFWDLLVSGESSHEEVPASRFTLEDFFDPTQTLENAVLNRFGCFLKNPGLFDHGFFKISPREAMQMDPLHRMFLMTTYEALEQAGFGETNPNSMHPARISTFFSQTTDDWRTINDQQGIDTHYAPCSNRAFASGRIAHYFGFSGAVYNVDTACSSSATSIHLACHSLLHRESDTAIVGGGSLCVLPEPFSGLGKGGFLSLSTENGSCKTFQESADGYCRGEAVAVVVLKRLEDAVSENDNILAVIRGSTRNSNAADTSIAFPSDAAQEALFREILRKSHVDPNEVGFIEMHGTGTQAGDKAEMKSVRSVFAQNRTTCNPLHVGSVKANIGHSEAAAGVVSLIKAVLMLRHNGAIPAQPGYPFAPNRNFGNLATANIKIADGLSSIQAPVVGDGTRKILVNNFDAAGGNTGLLVQDAPEFRPRLPLLRCCHVVTTSGRTITALEANKVRLRNFLIDNPSVNISDVAYTTTARRLHEAHREAFVVASVAELCDSIAESQPVRCTPTDPSLLIFVFTGEGSLYTGMGSTLYKTAPYFRERLDSFQAASDTQGQHVNFIGIITGAIDVTQASTPARQMAIVALEIALAQFWHSLGLFPSLVMGHSLGEYAALCVAGVLSVTDALYLVYHRAVLIDEHCESDLYSMLAIAGPAVHVKQRLNKTGHSSCKISCVNGPSSTVVSGPRADLTDPRSMLHEEGLRTTELSVRYGFHSAQMDPILDPFENIAARVIFAKPRIPVASTSLVKIVTEKGVFGPSYLRNQMRQPVKFFQTVQACQAAGFIKNDSNLVEIGPATICASLVVQSVQNVSINFWGSLQPTEDDWKSINTILARAYAAGFPVAWQELYRYDLQKVQLIDLPKYAFDLTKYWHSYQRQGPTSVFDGPDSSSSGGSCPLTKLPYTGLQFLEAIDMGKGTVTFLSETAEPNLSRAIQGHVVDGVAICPASVFADMAVTAAAYVLHKTGTTVKAANMEIVHMKMTRPLVVHKNSENRQTVRVQVKVQKACQDVDVIISTEDNGEQCGHCTCTVHVHSSSETSPIEWAKIQKRVKVQVKALKHDAAAGVAHQMNTGVLYKLFGDLVQYSKEYMSIKEAFVDEDFCQAAATVNLSNVFGSGQFTLNPFALDAVVHLAGFLLNADFSKPAGDIYIANHIENLHVLEDLLALPKQTCTCFATICKQTTQAQALCNLFVFDDQRLIATCNVRFRKLDLEIFRSIVAKPRSDVLPAVRAPTQSRITVDTVRPENNGDNTECLSWTDEAISDLLVGTIARHTGINASEILSSCNTADLGIDSLMTLAILSDIENASSLRLPAGFFTKTRTIANALAELQLLGKHVEFATIGSASNSLAMNGASAPDATSANGNRSRTVEYVGSPHECLDPSPTKANEQHRGLAETWVKNWTPENSGYTADTANETKVHTNAHMAPLEPEKTAAKSEPAISRPVLIQGRPDNNERPLFLITDGSGTVSGYIHLPAPPSGRRIYALESPFMERPTDYTLSIEEMARIFIRAVRQEQPSGPYFIGGWSAGGVYAYEICYQLVQQGETISGLILIDTAITRPVLSAFESSLALIQETGVLSGVKFARSSVPGGNSDLPTMHIASTVRAVAQYDPRPFPKGKEPLHTHLIWATESIDLEEPRDDAVWNPDAVCSTDNNKPSLEMTFSDYLKWLRGLLHSKRTDFGAHVWERLVGEDIHVATVEGDHFSIVRPPYVEQLGAIILDAVAIDTQLESGQII